MGSHPESRPDWASLSVLQRSRLPPRADFKIYDSEADALSRDVAKARCLSLSGAWKFHLANSPFEAPSGFEVESFDSSYWDDIDVPGMWQMQGFGRGPQYTNVQYPFFVDPPYPPYTGNECGSYLTSFTVPEHIQDDQLRLRFEGVDSAFHVWVNAEAAGYSQGSRSPAEFDVTRFVKKCQPNVLAVRVYQFCDGSYIEDQDQWWLSGIFRDVFLLGFAMSAHVEDLSIETELDQQYKDAELKIQIRLVGKGHIELKLLDGDGKKVTSIAREATPSVVQSTLDFSLPVRNPHKWTAETPYLYQLVVSLEGSQFSAHNVGFRKVELKDGLIMVNGQRIVFKGANRHEHHPKHGRAVPYEFMRRDLLLMKTHNINSIRTCHQPSDPRMYDLADELGFWVMDEADLECHGFELIAEGTLTPEEKKLPYPERQRLTRTSAAKWTSDNPEWRDAYLERADRLVARDKLHPSVIIWSLGNEAFYGRNHTAMADSIRSTDSTRLIHYEPDLEAEHMDMHSRMYPHLHEIVTFAEDRSRTKPLVLCEFIHAMGTGPGNVKEYIDLFYKYPSLQGGWVWEWANHGLRTKTSEGTAYFGYGGDFGDVPNDSNFAMDGVLDSDHTPNSGLLEYKKAIEPVQVIFSSPERLTIINRRDFTTLNDLKCTWHLVSEVANSAQSGTIEMPEGMQPGATADLALPKVNLEGPVEALLTLSFRLKDDTKWALADHEVATAQVQLTPISKVTIPAVATGNAVRAEEVGSKLLVQSETNKWVLDFASGALISWKKADQKLIAQPLEPTFYRAPTDNDAPRDGAVWKDRFLHLGRPHTRRVDWKESDGDMVVTVRQKFGPSVLSWSLDLQRKYTFQSSGALKIEILGEPRGDNLPLTLPRIGVTIGLPSEFQKVEWFGRGPGEGYKDFKLSQLVDVHTVSKIDDLWAAPEFPQECSNRTDTRWLKISSADASLTAQFFDPDDTDQRRCLFDFMACHYDVGDIDKARHPHELEKHKNDNVVLRLDADHHGLGTGSCGQKTLEEYALKTEPFRFGILLY